MSDKVQLKDPRPTKVIELPSFKDSKIEIYPYLLMRDIAGVDVSLLEDATKNAEQGLKLLPKLIKSWNFTDEKNEDLPVTKENIEVLPTDDVVFIFNEIKAFAEEQKKSSTT